MSEPKKPSPRAERRAKALAEEKLAKKRIQLAKVDAGGSPERPIDVVSASVIDTRAKAMPCPRCLGTSRVEEHAAETIEGKRLRIARMQCAQCGAKRAVYFRIVRETMN